MRQSLGVALKRFLKPDCRKGLLFVLFLLLAAGGQIQAWAFSDDPATKPPLYDLLRPLPLWFAWVITMVPLFGLMAILRSLGWNYSGAGLNVAYRIALVVYYYLLACALVGLVDLVRR